MSQHHYVSEINGAIGAHGAWKLKLSSAVRVGSSSLTAREAACDRTCKFGAWLHGPGIDAKTKGSLPYQVIKRLHAEFHQSASRVIALVDSGQRKEASGALEGEFTQRSEKLVRALSKWKGELSR